MMNLQSYALTGKKTRPDYVGVINANKKYLPQKKSLADEQAYRDKMFGLDTKRLDMETQASKDALSLNRDILKANQKASDTSTMIGTGQLLLAADQGRKKDMALTEAISGGGSTKPVSGTVAPESVSSGASGPLQFDEPYKAGGVSMASAAPETDFWSGLGKGASNWGNIAGSSITGGTVGAALGEKIGGKNTASRVIGGAAVAGGLSYLSSGDPYTAAISAIFGGSLGGWG